jgi:cell division protein FtsZ
MAELKFDMPNSKANIIKVIGVGGGGSNAVNHMVLQGIVGVDFAICNTDIQALESSPVNNKIHLGPLLTEGRGAGSRPEVGKEACIESIEEIRRFLENNTKMLFVTAGMGGGTGTGAAPIIAKAAREMDILTVGIVTLPFSFEGLKRSRQALEGLEELKKNVDALVVISNDKLRQIYGNQKISDAFGSADNILSTAAKGIAEIITVPGYINVDFEDVNTVMRDSGVAIMGTSIVAGEDRAHRAVTEALNSPLLEDNDIRGAQNILLNIASGSEEVTLEEIYEITEFVQEEAGYGTNLIWGNCTDESLGDSISVTIIATGFETGNYKSIKKEEEKVKVPLEEEHPEERNDVFDIGVLENTSAESTIEFDDVKDEIRKHPRPMNFDEPREKPVAEPDAEREEEIKRRREVEFSEKEKIRNNNLVQLNNPKNISQLESEPAYLRRKVSLDDVEHSSEHSMSRYTISMDDEGPELREDNAFLHDNVD